METLRALVQTAADTIISHIEKNKLLLIHPSSQYRNLLIASLLSEQPYQLYYYGLGFEDVSLESFLTGMVRSLADQDPTFGKRVNSARIENPDDIEFLARSLAADFDDLYSDHYLLILDEYDRVDEVPEVQIFIEHLLEYLPSQCHLLINSRSLPRLPWVALVAKGEAAVLRDEKMLASGFYSENYSENPNVEVFALGPGYVIVNGQPVSTWEGHLPRLLFFFTLDRPMVTRSEICKTFWPDLSLEQAVNVFHVTKRRLHKALGFDVLVHDGGHYQVNPVLNLKYDVLEFVESLVNARNMSEDEAIEYWSHAVDLYHGGYLQGHKEDWIVKRRNDFQAGYLEALVQLAHIKSDRGNYEEALGLLLRATSEAQNREDLHRDVIELYGVLGRHAEAAEHYASLEKYLGERYGITPAPETRNKYESVVGA